jgi:hypothetical protein
MLTLVKGKITLEYTKEGGATHNWKVFLDGTQIGWLHDDGGIGGALDEEQMDLYFDEACTKAASQLAA